MSLEQAIQALTVAVNANTAALAASHFAAPQAQSAAPLAQPAHGAIQGAASTTFAGGATPSPTSGMPAAPTFGFPTQQAAAPAVQAPMAPFSTQQELFNYTGAAYQAMGPEKGGKIQGILQTMGLTNLNDVKPEQYGNFYALVEQLKVSV